MQRLAFSLILVACRPVTSSNSSAGNGVSPQSETSDAAGPATATLTLRLRGSSAGGMLVAVPQLDTQYLAPGTDLSLMLPKGTQVQVTGEALSRLGAGGSRVVRWGADCSGVSCSYKAEADASVTIVAEDILYVGSFGHTDNVYALSFDGTSSRQITHFTAPGLFIRSLAVSPNGEWVVYSSNRALGGSDATGPAANLWLQPAHSGDAVPLTRSFNADSSAPAWSPDSKTLAFASRLPLRGGQTSNPFSNIWRVDVESHQAQPVTALGAAWSDQPTFSPDGASLVFLSSRALSGDDTSGPGAFVWMTATDGSSPRWLTDIAASAIQAPIFSANGNDVAFAACDNLSCTMRSAAAVHSDASGPRRLAALAPSALPAIARQSDKLVVLGPSQLLVLGWNGVAASTQPITLPLALYPGPFFVTEQVDTSVPSSDWHLRSDGLDKRFSVDALGSVAVTPQ